MPELGQLGLGALQCRVETLELVRNLVLTNFATRYRAVVRRDQHERRAARDTRRYCNPLEEWPGHARIFA
jgi:hypothetical protein